jgi:acyl carrier protein
MRTIVSRTCAEVGIAARRALRTRNFRPGKGFSSQGVGAGKALLALTGTDGRVILARRVSCPRHPWIDRERGDPKAMTMSRDDPADVALETNFRENLEADSLDLAELIMDFEDKFGVGDISEEEALKIQTVGDAVDYIYNELATA